MYRRILGALDLTDDSVAVARRIAALAQQCAAEVQLLHVVEFVPIEPMSDALVPVVQIDDKMLARATEQIRAIAGQVGLPPDCCRVESGNVKSEIIRIARETQAELIVLGSRERHGLSILVNMTEDTVLHGAPCDVLAVRVR
ncbi:MAG: universal stress protein [Gammaproteobacteria bacterium]|nr:universal stress protein [Gammaproteobacteria bacterium]